MDSPFFTWTSFIADAISIGKLLLTREWWISAATWVRPATRRGHAREVRERVTSMPFIYNLTAGEASEEDQPTVASDYVPIQLVPLNLGTLAPSANSERGAPDNEIWDDDAIARLLLRSNRRALILGPAGIGKSTLLRRASLEHVAELGDRYTEDLFPEASRLVPFFVPLKAVNRSQELPILRYILRSYPYVYGPRGLRKLTRLAKRRELFLVLDGYDEMLFGEEYGTNISEELDAIFAKDIPTKARKRRRHFKFYFSLRNCCVWLSSRKDFYANHRLSIDSKFWNASYDDLVIDVFHKLETGRKPSHVLPTFPAVEICGVEEKAQLVERVLDRYKRKQPLVFANVDPPGFFRWVESEYDEDTQRFQSNPLFLTVMCYLYADSVARPAQKSQAGPPTRHSLSHLIGNCVSLLLTDLDEYRIREMPGKFYAIRARLENPDEKRAFLRYFAALLFYDRRFEETQVFDRGLLYEVAEEFAIRDQWAETLANPIRRRAKQNLIEQLITQEVFVVVDRTPQGEVFDFPHRRFREVLAVEQLDSPDGLRLAKEKLGDKNFEELFKVFFALTESYRHVLLEEVLGRIEPGGDGYFMRLAATLLDLKPAHYDATSVLRDCLCAAIDQGRITDISEQLSRHCRTDEALATWLVRRGLSEAAGANSEAATRHLLILERIRPDIFKSAIADLARAATSGARRIAYATAMRRDAELFFDLFRAAGDAGRRELLEYAAHEAGPDRRFWRVAVEVVSDSQQALLANLGASADVLNAVKTARRRRQCLMGVERYLQAHFQSFEVKREPTNYEQELLTVRRDSTTFTLLLQLPETPEPPYPASESIVPTLASANVAMQLLLAPSASLQISCDALGVRLATSRPDHYMSALTNHFASELGELSLRPSLHGNSIQLEFLLEQRYRLTIENDFLETVEPDAVAAWCDQRQLPLVLIRSRRSRAAVAVHGKGLRRGGGAVAVNSNAGQAP